MKTTALQRLVAVLLCLQPVFWMSDVALAQSIGQQRQDYGQPGGPFGQPGGSFGQPGGSFGRQGGSPDTYGQPGGPTDGSVQLSGPEFQLSPSPGEREITTEQRRPSTTSPALVAIDAPVDPDKYVLAHGDVLELNLWGVQNLSFRATVDVEGRIFVPKVGYFDLRDRTLSDARRLIGSAVSKYYRLSFGISLAEPRTFLVQVVDDVVRPGSYPARATDRAATVIKQAGGPGKNSSLRRIEIRRRDGKVIPVDLLLYSMTGDVKYNPNLLDGDVVKVPFEKLVGRIEGAVNRPGRYELVGRGDLAELVELAGGLSPAATRVLPISIAKRTESDTHERMLVEWTDREIPAVPIGSEDTVRIPSLAEVELSVLVVGAVAGATVATQNLASTSSGSRATTTLAVAPEEASATRRVPYARGDTVGSILQRVGGVGPLADLRRSYITRGERAIPVDLQTLLMLRDSKADQAIEIGDILVIPFQRRNVSVEGAVFAPGLYPFNPNFGIEHYIALAGGANRFAQPLEDVRLVAPDGTTKPFARDLKVEPGSGVVVPERNFTRSEIVQIIISAAAIALSGVAVIISASK